MNRICALLLLPVAGFMLSLVKAEDKPSEAKPTVIIETMKFDNVDVISIHTKGTRVLARTLTLDDGSTIKPHADELEIRTGKASIRTKKLETYVKLNIKQVDLIRIEIEPVQN